VNYTPVSGSTGPAFSIQPVGSWAAPVGANWIDPYANWLLANDPAGDYEFENQFFLNASAFYDYKLELAVAADNSAEVVLNGTSVGFAPGFATKTTIIATIPALFLPGPNSVTARVENLANPTPTPMGLLVEGGVFARCTPEDCNDNGVFDAYDIANGTSNDANSNGIPDECEVDPCPWDTAPAGGDGNVGLGDLNGLLSNWGPCPAPCPWDFAPPGGDGSVGLGDLNALLSNWGPCP
jgi:hypothetical protein